MQGESVSGAMLAEGYSPATAKNPKNLTGSTGFQKLCEENGLTDELLIKSLVADIKKKPQNRKPELELGFRVKGQLDEKTKGGTYNQFNFFAGDQLKRAARKLLDDERIREAEANRIPDSDQP